MTSPSPSSSYANPPVAEVALAVYFSPPMDLRSIHFGQLWERWRERYPRSEDQPLLPPVGTEDVGPGASGIEVQFVAGSPGTRVWYLSEDKCHVLQVQRDRLVLNWRRMSPDQGYPRYGTLRPEFGEALEALVGFAADQGLADPVIRQAEVTYVNPVPVSSVTPSEGLSGLLAPWSGRYSDDFLPAPEEMQILVRHRIPGVNGEPIGRLYIDCRSGLHQPVGTATGPEHVYLLRLFARGRVLGGGVDGALEFLDLGHNWVVRGFTSVTTTSMHGNWGKER